MISNCDAVRGTLPWLLNGTLSGDERQQVLEHLSTCETCRRDLAETRLAAEIFDQHPPAGAILALAWDETPSGVDPALLEEHLAACPRCAADLELARMSRRLEEDERVVPLVRRTTPVPVPAPARSTGWRGWKAAALAAGLAGVVTSAGWFQTAGRVHTLEENLASQTAVQAPPPAAASGAPGEVATVEQLAAKVEERERTIETLEAELNAAQKQAEELSGRVDQLAQARPAPQTPQINGCARDLTPTTDVVRGGAAEPMEVPGRTYATLVLNSVDPETESHREHVVEIEDSTGKVVWNANGLALDPETKGYSLTLPPGSLRPGGYTILVYGLTDGRREPAESYPIRVK
jgi:predicted anti-sigma-YlaC factor YlaD